jgi:sialic acid synthase SpsE
MAKAKRMIRDAHKAGAECVKFQAHVVDDEMVPIAKKIIPGHALLVNARALSEGAIALDCYCPWKMVYFT